MCIEGKKGRFHNITIEPEITTANSEQFPNRDQGNLHQTPQTKQGLEVRKARPTTLNVLTRCYRSHLYGRDTSHPTNSGGVATVP